MSDSPNSLTRPIKGTKSGNRIVYLGIAVATILVLVFVYSLSQSGKKSDSVETGKAANIDTDLKQPLTAPENLGISTPPQEKEKEPETQPLTEKPLITVIRPAEPSEAAKQRVKELLEVRTFKLERMKAALAAPLKIQTAMPDKNERKVIQTSFDDVRARHPLNAPGVTTGIPVEPNDQQEKEEFLNSRAAKDGSWQLPYERVPGRRFELKTGSVITGIMISGINSDLPGQIIGQVSKNIYDTASGTYMLIPQGSRMIGVYDSRVAVGQSRVLVAWNRIIFPDGSSITLGVMPGTDIGGYAGYSGDVDNHYLKTFGSAAIMSLISGGTAYAMDSFNKSSSSNQTPTLQDELGSAVASQLGQSTLQLLQMNVKLKPAISTEPGKRFNMVVTKDIVFARPYLPYRSQ
ncbi:TrbI/VirB10 family protein [Maridesulfovibrio ferrireducens]|uniref:TrbI/VirB10 family protein n=1 Tax=Maridesulfovibrio ferrireducens TaxID=246191 RepID=UPI001A34D705|nr:TrbI/VirB10 family protein [Maridesulfovibrio ferrireducens]MBI9112354.1 conjugal transfer protein TrbI [Maridesulfovibrio ferrireducens]